MTYKEMMVIAKELMPEMKEEDLREKIQWNMACEEADFIIECGIKYLAHNICDGGQITSLNTDDEIEEYLNYLIECNLDNEELVIQPVGDDETPPLTEESWVMDWLRDDVFNLNNEEDEQNN